MSNIINNLIQKALKETFTEQKKRSSKSRSKTKSPKKPSVSPKLRPKNPVSFGDKGKSGNLGYLQPQGAGGGGLGYGGGGGPRGRGAGGGMGPQSGPGSGSAGSTSESAMEKSADNMAMYGKKAKMREAEITAGDDNTKFRLKVDVSNPQSETKLGVRLQLTPKEGMLEPDIKDTLETAIMKKLNTSLSDFNIQVSKDTDVPNPEVIGFFIPLAQIKNMIVKSIKGPGGAAPKPFKPDLEKDALQRSKISQMMDKEKQAQAAKQTTNESINDLINDQLITEMRQRTLNEISQIVMREDFYGFINSGNNMLRSLEERGYDMREAKKYLGYLVKHNIM